MEFVQPLFIKKELNIEIPSLVTNKKHGKILKDLLLKKEHIELVLKFKENIKNTFELFLDVRNMVNTAKFV